MNRETATVRVVVVENTRSSRNGLKMAFKAFNQEVAIIGEASSATDGIKAICNLRPDVVILDLRLPERNGVQEEALFRNGIRVLEACNKLSPPARVLVYSSLDDNPFAVYKVRKLGALGFISKEEDRSDLELVTAVQCVASGRPIDLGEKIQRHLNNLAHLTKDEEAIFELLAQGLSNKQIQSARGTPSIRTVENQVASILDKLQVDFRQAFIIDVSSDQPARW